MQNNNPKFGGLSVAFVPTLKEVQGQLKKLLGEKRQGLHVVLNLCEGVIIPTAPASPLPTPTTLGPEKCPRTLFPDRVRKF